MRVGWALLAGAALASGAGASTYGMPRTIRCPVGGETFQWPTLASYSRWGALPDGQPIGSAPFPLPIPQCPKNGLPVYDDFDKAAVAKLAPLVASAEFKALRAAGETPRYLTQWLQQRMGAPAIDSAWVLLQASWEAKNRDDPARASRYNAEYVTRAASLAGDPLAVHGMAARRVNALRELSRFEEAEAARTALLAVPVTGEGDERREREGWHRYLTSLAAPIARRDAARAPIDLLGRRDQAFRCLGAGREGEPPLTAFERDHCATPELVHEVDGLRKVREATDAARN